MGAREARRKLNRADVRPESENGVVERGGSCSAAGGDADAIRSFKSIPRGGRGLVELPPARRSSPAVDKVCFSWSFKSSAVLVVLRFGLFSWAPTTAP